MKAGPRFRASRTAAQPPSLRDRLVFGAISGLFGAVLGLAAGLVAAMLFRTSAALAAVVVLSAIYFFCVGVVRGPDAAFLVAEAFHAAEMAVRAQAATNGVFPDPAQREERLEAWGAAGLLVIWLAMVGVLTWLW